MDSPVRSLTSAPSSPSKTELQFQKIDPKPMPMSPKLNSIPKTDPSSSKPQEDDKTKEKADNSSSYPKHPLHTPWKYWWFDRDVVSRGGSWSESMQSVMKFSTVEDFWSIHGYIKAPSELKMGHSYYVFREGIKPEWEDDANKNGGRWVITLEKRNSMQATEVDEVWLNVLCCLIGEAFQDEGDEVTGVAVDVRAKFDRIAIWTKNFGNEEAIMKIGRILQKTIDKEVGGFQRLPMSYEAHKEGGDSNRRPEILFKM